MGVCGDDRVGLDDGDGGGEAFEISLTITNVTNARVIYYTEIRRVRIIFRTRNYENVNVRYVYYCAPAAYRKTERSKRIEIISKIDRRSPCDENESYVRRVY